MNILHLDTLYLDTCKSTNLTAREILDNCVQNQLEPSRHAPQVIVSRKQTQGKGRSGNWFSPEDSGIYMSIIRSDKWVESPGWNRWLQYQIEGMEGLTRLFGSYIEKILSDYFKLQLSIQGINDIYLADKKLAGILVEHHVASEMLIIGIGLNTFHPVKIRKDLINKAVWLNDYAAEYLIDHKKLVQMITEEIIKI